MGRDGWLGIGWPKEYGGQGRGVLDQFVFFDEVQRAGAPFPFVTINTVGPTLMTYGSDEHKRDYLPGILNGDVNFAIGYTEPEAGTDLASLRTKAVRDGEEWVINGNKVFTSGANQADYIWLACRTDPDAKKHKGISMIIVPTASPGFKTTPIVTVGSVVTQATYYDDVRVPIGNVVGDVNGGWRLITNQLNHERVGLAALAGLTFRLYDDVEAWCRETPAGARRAGRADDRRAVGAAAARERTRAARGAAAAQLADGVRGRRRHAHPDRRVIGEGVRGRDADQGVPDHVGDPRRGWLRARGPARRRAAEARSSARLAPRRSTRSAAVSSRCCARSWRPSASA